MEKPVKNVVFNIADSATLSITEGAKMLSIIADFAPIAIAIIAISFTYRQIKIQQEHNKLSVKPFLDSYTIEGGDIPKAKFKMVLRNSGSGTAFIDEYLVLKDGKPCDIKKEFDLLLESVAGEGMYGWGTKGSAMSPQDKIVLLEIDYEIESEEEIKVFEEKANSIDFRIKYSSIYGEQWTYDSKKGKEARAAIQTK